MRLLKLDNQIIGILDSEVIERQQLVDDIDVHKNLLDEAEKALIEYDRLVNDNEPVDEQTPDDDEPDVNITIEADNVTVIDQPAPSEPIADVIPAPEPEQPPIETPPIQIS